MTTVIFSGSDTSSISDRSSVAQPLSDSRSLPHRYQYIAQVPPSAALPQADREKIIARERSSAAILLLIYIPPVKCPKAAFSWLQTLPR